MRKSMVLVGENSIYFNERKYNLYDLDDVKINLTKQVTFVLEEQEIYIQKFILDTKKKLKNFVREKISEIFSDQDDILYNFEIEKKKNVIYIYSIKGRKNLEILCRNVNDINVLPLQFAILESMKKLKVCDESYIAVIKFGSYYYAILVNCDVISYTYLDKSLEILTKNIFERDACRKIYMDSSIDLKNNVGIVKKDILRVLNEKIFRK